MPLRLRRPSPVASPTRGGVRLRRQPTPQPVPEGPSVLDRLGQTLKSGWRYATTPFSWADESTDLGKRVRGAVTAASATGFTGPFGITPRIGYEATRALFGSPIDTASTVGSVGSTALLSQAAKAPKLFQALRATDVGSSVGMAGLGLEKAVDTDADTSQRLMGVLQAALGGVSARSASRMRPRLAPQVAAAPVDVVPPSAAAPVDDMADWTRLGEDVPSVAPTVSTLRLKKLPEPGFPRGIAPPTPRATPQPTPAPEMTSGFPSELLGERPLPRPGRPSMTPEEAAEALTQLREPGRNLDAARLAQRTARTTPVNAPPPRGPLTGGEGPINLQRPYDVIAAGRVPEARLFRLKPGVVPQPSRPAGLLTAVSDVPPEGPINLRSPYSVIAEGRVPGAQLLELKPGELPRRPAGLLPPAPEPAPVVPPVPRKGKKRTPRGQEGKIPVNVLTRLGLGTGGAAYGAATGETPRERIERATIFGTAGALAPSMFTRAGATLADELPTGGRVSKVRVAETPEKALGIDAAGEAVPLPPTIPQPKAQQFRTKQQSHLPPEYETYYRTFLKDNEGFQAQRRGRVPVARTVEESQRTPINITNPLTERGVAANAAQMKAHGDAMTTKFADLKALQDTLATSTDPADAVKLQAATQEAVAAQMIYEGKATEAGRALHIQRIMKRALDTHDERFIRQAQRLGMDAKQVAAKLTEAQGDPLKLRQILRDAQSTTLTQKAEHYLYGNMLSGLVTHERNLIGNTTTLLSKAVTSPVGAGYDALRSLVTGKPRQQRLGELLPQATGALYGVQKGWRGFVQTIKTGLSPLEDVSSAGFDTSRIELAGGGMNPWNLPGRFLEASDTFFRSIVKESELYGMAYTQAKNEVKGGGLTASVQKRMAQILAAPPTEMMAKAEAMARRGTFQEQPGKIGTGLLALKRSMPWLAPVIPFIKTPANLIRQGMEFTPAGAVMGLKNGGRQGAEQVARAALGTVALVPLWMLAEEGKLTGSLPRQKSKRDMLSAGGVRPNSIRVGDTWYGYGALGPLAVPLTLVANAHAAMKDKQAQGDDEGAASLAFDVALRAGASVLQQSYLAGLSSLVEAINAPEEEAATFFQRTAQAFVPASGLLREVTRATDPVLRKPENTVEDALRASIPGLSQTVEPRLDVWGREAVRPGGPARRWLDPTLSSPVVDDPALRALSQAGLGKTATQGPETMQLARGHTVALTPEERLAHAKRQGMSVKEAIDVLSRSPGFARLTRDQKATYLRRAMGRARTRTNAATKAQLWRLKKPTVERPFTEDTDPTGRYLNESP